MTARAKPPFRADQVGSLIRPPELIEARQKRASGALSAAELSTLQQAAIRTIVAAQEKLGLKAVTDGEYNRTSWQSDFLTRIANVERVPSKLKVRFHSQAGTRDHHPPSLAVTGRISRPEPIFVGDFAFLKSVATAVPKVTLPSPTILHFRGGRDSIDRTAYPDIEAFYADVAAVYRAELSDLYAAGCRYAQIDEVNLAYLCDPALRAEVANFGEDPDALPHTYAKLLNDCISGLPADMTICLHLCRGNFAGAWIAEGGYDPVADLLFNEINATGYFLEFDSVRAGGFEPLRLLPAGKVAVLGLVTTKSPDLESKDALKRRIEDAARFADLDRLALSPQCGFSSGIGGETMSMERQLEKLQLVVDTAIDVWGSA
jgi:5-methyltetrahydropteroyltriglutamate--homocysteine methyltransferase